MNASSSKTLQNLPVAGVQALLSLSGSREETDLDIARKWPATAGIVAGLAVENRARPRRVRLHISFGSLPEAGAPWGARFWEADAPTGVKPVEWLLVSDSPVCCVEDALRLLHASAGLVTAVGCF